MAQKSDMWLRVFDYVSLEHFKNFKFVYDFWNVETKQNQILYSAVIKLNSMKYTISVVQALGGIYTFILNVIVPGRRGGHSQYIMEAKDFVITSHTSA